MFCQVCLHKNVSKSKPWYIILHQLFKVYFQHFFWSLTDQFFSVENYLPFSNMSLLPERRVICWFKGSLLWTRLLEMLLYYQYFSYFEGRNCSKFDLRNYLNISLLLQVVISSVFVPFVFSVANRCSNKYYWWKYITLLRKALHMSNLKNIGPQFFHATHAQ